MFNIFNKVISINNKRTDGYNDMLGYHYLYPEGTYRKIKKLTFLGWRMIEQVSEIKCSVSIDGCIHYNKWKKISLNNRDLIKIKNKLTGK